MRASYIVIPLILLFTLVTPSKVINPTYTYTYQFKTHTVIKLAMERPHVRQASRGTQHREYIGMFEATAYNLTKNPTATGLRTRRGIVAVDPRMIKLGTRLYIEGYGYAVASDTGGAIQGRDLDLWIRDYSDCIKFGRRQVKVWRVR